LSWTLVLPVREALLYDQAIVYFCSLRKAPWANTLTLSSSEPARPA
jgi:hypothetical protein